MTKRKLAYLTYGQFAAAIIVGIILAVAASLVFAPHPVATPGEDASKIVITQVPTPAPVYITQTPDPIVTQTSVVESQSTLNTTSIIVMYANSMFDFNSMWLSAAIIFPFLIIASVTRNSLYRLFAGILLIICGGMGIISVFWIPAAFGLLFVPYLLDFDRDYR